jgi:AcrR family transcriptional regulator
MPRYLTDQDIADFRAELCKVATERFARFGYEGVTMRQLAEALGCSPKTPYRYFKDKADILATVRAQAFAKFADTLEKAASVTEDPMDRGRLTGEAYLKFAMAHPHAYRIMFEIEQPIDESHEELAREAKRARQYITRYPAELAKRGVIGVDPQMFGWSMWATIHGLVMLNQAGMLQGEHDMMELNHFHAVLMLKGAAPSKTAAKKPAETSGKKK